MYVIEVPNVNYALHDGLDYLAHYGVLEETRNGPAIVAPGPVSTVYTKPWQRVLFSPKRDANPFFHLVEAMWIIAGRKDVKSLAMFNKRIADYSDNSIEFHGAYGYRLRSAQGFDQIRRAIGLLRATPDSRQVALQIWDAKLDLGAKSKDIPCNDFVLLRIRKDPKHALGKVLDLTVANRSNDVIWGAYGANAVQFSFLQEYMAAAIGVGMGRYTQISHNYHAYTQTPYWEQFESDEVPVLKYLNHTITIPLIGPPESPQDLDEDLGMFFKMLDSANSKVELLDELDEFDRALGFNTAFINTVFTPMVRAFLTRDSRTLNSAIDWHRAGAEWIDRRKHFEGVKV